MLYTYRDWPWKLILLLAALLGAFLYVLYQMGPRVDVALLLLVGVVLPVFSRDDAAALVSVIVRALYAGLLAILLWWGGFWSPAIAVCADLCQAAETGR